MSLKSSNIQVFPTSIARPDFPYARVFTEEHILSITRNAAPCDSYVITSSYDAKKVFEFVIHGYYVRLAENTTFTSNDVYAHIYIDTTSPTNPQLYGVDENDVFTGVDFTSTDAANPPAILTQNGSHYEHYCLKILTKESDTYTIPVSSFKVIDGGEID